MRLRTVLDACIWRSVLDAHELPYEQRVVKSCWQAYAAVEGIIEDLGLAAQLQAAAAASAAAAAKRRAGLRQKEREALQPQQRRLSAATRATPESSAPPEGKGDGASEPDREDAQPQQAEDLGRESEGNASKKSAIDDNSTEDAVMSAAADRDGPECQSDGSVKVLEERLSALEAENRDLRTMLSDCKRRAVESNAENRELRREKFELQSNLAKLLRQPKDHPAFSSAQDRARQSAPATPTTQVASAAAETGPPVSTAPRAAAASSSPVEAPPVASPSHAAVRPAQPGYDPLSNATSTAARRQNMRQPKNHACMPDPLAEQFRDLQRSSPRNAYGQSANAPTAAWHPLRGSGGSGLQELAYVGMAGPAPSTPDVTRNSGQGSANFYNNLPHLQAAAAYAARIDYLDFYSVLRVRKDASEDAIKQAYYREGALWHPDRYPGSSTAAEKIFRTIGAAYVTLVDPARRAVYDGRSSGGGASGDPVMEVLDHACYLLETVTGGSETKISHV
eukprot:TRINITY_DN20489_c1_g2_i3.p1 TRINITY_DN20489_c1_g2~~TRINITY_DN20489_c1_g2_i3.p1  ORF type:complete len:507 (-),score=99.77 TRINITY_DN20489_c1_g2_i3:490-2010(-)